MPSNRHRLSHRPGNRRACGGAYKNRPGRLRMPGARALIGVGLIVASLMSISGCGSPADYRRDADAVAHGTIHRAQWEALGETSSFSVLPEADRLRRRLLRDQDLPVSADASWGLGALQPPDAVRDRFLIEQDRAALADLDPLPPGAVVLDLPRSLMVAAANSRDYQSRKERVFRTALRLDLERDDFRGSWEGNARVAALADLMEGEDRIGSESGGALAYSRRFLNGVSIAGAIGLDLVKLLTFDRSAALGLVGDLSISIPLLRGSSRFVVSEPLRQAERDVIYAIYEFERFKQTFAVQIASNYLDTLSALDRIETSAENYRSLALANRRARRLAQAGRLPEIQVDQAHQNELRARQRWVSASQAYQNSLDQFKLTLGLPVDAHIALDPASLENLEDELVVALTADQGDATPEPEDDGALDLSPPEAADGRWNLEPEDAIRTALDRRKDLRVAIGKIDDALRRIGVAADDLRADLRLFGRGSAGAHRSLRQAGLADSEIRPERGNYSLLLSLDLPFDRSAERNTYRASWIALEEQLRDLQKQEDLIKAAVRGNLRTLVEAREQVRIQAQSLSLAERRVASTELFLQAGRVEIRDLLDAQESLLSSQNQLTSAVIAYRSAEWNLQSNVGLLEIGNDGLWPELRKSDETNDGDRQPGPGVGPAEDVGEEESE